MIALEDLKNYSYDEMALNDIEALLKD